MKDENEISESEWMRSMVEAHAADINRYATSILYDPDTARDVVQDVFLRLWKEPRDKVESHVRLWLFHVCRNRALEIRRKGKRMKKLEDTDLEQTLSDNLGPEHVAERKDSLEQILEMTQSLPENQREVVRLKFQNGMSYREIADVTEFTVSNVGFLLHTAIKTLRARVEAVGE